MNNDVNVHKKNCINIITTYEQGRILGYLSRMRLGTGSNEFLLSSKQ